MNGQMVQHQWVYARALIEWGDGIALHGRLVTIFPVRNAGKYSQTDKLNDWFPYWIRKCWLKCATSER